MARRVDDVDLHTLVRDGDILGQDRDPTLPFQIVRIENLLARKLRFAELPALAQHTVDQRRLSMIDVGNDGNVPQVVTSFEHGSVEDSMRRGSGHDNPSSYPE